MDCVTKEKKKEKREKRGEGPRNNAGQCFMNRKRNSIQEGFFVTCAFTPVRSIFFFNVVLLTGSVSDPDGGDPDPSEGVIHRDYDYDG